MKKRNFWVRHLLPMLLAALVAMPLGGTLGKYITPTAGGTPFTLTIDEVVSSVNLYGAQCSNYREYFFNKALVFGNINDYRTEIEGLTATEVTDIYDSNKVVAWFYHDDECSYFLTPAIMNLYLTGTFNMEEAEENSPSEIYFSNINTDNFTFGGLFIYNEIITKVDMSKLNITNSISMGGMFEGCSNLTTVVFPEITSGKLTDTSRMFYGCKTIKEVDLSSVDLSGVTSFSNMFAGCSYLSKIYVSSDEDKTFIVNNSYNMGLINEFDVYVNGSNAQSASNIALVPNVG